MTRAVIELGCFALRPFPVLFFNYLCAKMTVTRYGNKIYTLTGTLVMTLCFDEVARKAVGEA